ALTGTPGGDELALSIRDVDVPGRLHMGHLDVASSARLLIVGGNGAGKSTLLTVLAGQLTPATGVVHRKRGVRVSLLEQDVILTDPASSPRRLYAEAAGPDSMPLAQLGLL